MDNGIKMKIKYSPQISENSISYEINGESIVCNLNGEIDNFDFSDVPAGSLVEVESSLEIKVVESVKRDENGVLWVKLYKPINRNSSYEDKFPDWIEV